MTAHGIPNESVVARLILKDYVKGKLCYIYPPPGVDATEFNSSSYNVNQITTSIGTPLEFESAEQSGNKEGNFLDRQEGHTKKSKRQKKQNRKHLEPTIRPDPNEVHFLAQESVVAHTKGNTTTANQVFTRTKFKHSPISTSELRALHQKTQSTSLEQTNA